MLITDTIQFQYYLADRHHPVEPSGRRWHRPLPASSGPDLTYGGYFTALSQYLARNRFERLLQAAAHRLAREIPLESIASIDIYLEKHGRFYHPARIAATLGGQTLNFVVNVAITKEGRTGLHRDVDNMQRLQSEYPYDFLPQMYACADVASTPGCALTMALGQWLDGFHEFHLSTRADSGRPIMQMWEPEHGSTSLTVIQTKAVYRQTAKILAAYLNVETFEQIQNWHNAAGDFVIQPRDDDMRARLVTVRHYGSLFDGLQISAENVLDLLVVFLINTSLRLGLDRCQGTGEPVWGGRPVLGAALKGCLDGLHLQVEVGRLPAELPGALLRHLKSYPVEELDALCRQLVQRWPPATIGRDLLQGRLASLGDALGLAIEALEHRF